MIHDFECDLAPDTKWPRIRLNLDNGWSVSLMVRTPVNGTKAMLASLAACPTGKWGEGVTEIGDGWNELGASEVIAIMAEIAARPEPGA